MAALGPEQLAHIARIARLALTPEEQVRFAAETEQILAHFAAVEAALGEPAAPALAAMEPRTDEPAPPDAAQVESMVGQMPRKDGRLAKVPEGL